ncbi:preprotein translocase subunit YajC [Geodermatophilus sp. Leaf369]|uniref:preprotein translocase subunit YajC n=1 Tax=Geodermatophilus sp. Leaf369 TaxID=1736354 RepID=UPI00070168C8|nr:preprotein translocase subunit YajC [Geodermatophilus sp. Leaf369]KQS59610.1 preprotein translocase subunit YajC [Geodermatophilus sp. Leaf369]QNG38397.1 preprotein translocase subunit YajC [Geodermatophilaceae bacterium NBWT11]
MEQFFPLILLVIAFALLIVLPARQRKKMAANAQTLQESLSVGAPVMLTSGLHGTVAGLGDGTVDIEIAPGVVATFARPAVMEIRKPDGAVLDATAGEIVPPSDERHGYVDGDGDPSGPSDRTR